MLGAIAKIVIIGGATITANVLGWWAIWTLFMGMGAIIGLPLLILCYGIVFYVTVKNLGNNLFIAQAIAMTIVFITFLYIKIL